MYLINQGEKMQRQRNIPSYFLSLGSRVGGSCPPPPPPSLSLSHSLSLDFAFHKIRICMLARAGRESRDSLVPCFCLTAPRAAAATKFRAALYTPSQGRCRLPVVVPLSLSLSRFLLCNRVVQGMQCLEHTYTYARPGRKLAIAYLVEFVALR